MYTSREKLELAADKAYILDLSDDDKSGMSSDVVIDEAIRRAGAYIDSFLRPIYSLPLAHTPKEIESAATDIALYYLHGRRALDEMPGQIRQAYVDATDLLKRIGDKKATLAIVPIEHPQESRGTIHTNTHRHRRSVFPYNWRRRY